MTCLALKEPITVGPRQVRLLSVRRLNHGRGFAPPGKGVIQASFDTDWEHWASLRENLPAYRAEKERVGLEVLRRLDALHPGLATQVEVTDMLTPFTTWRYTRNHLGAQEGWLPTPETIMTPIPRTLPGLSGFFLAGQWVVPGGGVPPCLYSGMHAVQLACRAAGMPFGAGPQTGPRLPASMRVD
jgi:phytoene dehydrogenase-like protein